MTGTRRIAIIYDWIDKWGGVERILLTLHEMFPGATFFTSYYDSQKAVWAKDIRIQTSFIQKLPSFVRSNRILSLPFYPYAFESFDLRNYDLVISVTSLFAKSVITRLGTTHLCYLLTPPRYLWFATDSYISHPFGRIIVSPFLSSLREYDYMVARRPDKIISISKTVADRCKKIYLRESDVVYPPFDIDYWTKVKKTLKASKKKRGQYYLIVGRLETYKKVDLAIKACNKMKKKLVVVGKGSQFKSLKAIAGETISFLSDVSDKELGYLYRDAEALIMPQEEDFGYVSLEAQFFKCPIIAYGKGGGAETISDGKTGVLFHNQTTASLIKAVARYHTISYNITSYLQTNGVQTLERFSKQRFIGEFTKLI